MKKIFLNFFIFLFIVFCFYFFWPKKKGIVVIINSPDQNINILVQKELQVLLYEPYVCLGMNNLFFETLPNKKSFKKYNDFIEENLVLIEERPVYKIFFKKPANDAIRSLHRSIACYAKEGVNLIVDYVLYKKEWISDLIEVLKDFPVYVIGLSIPLETIEKFEMENDCEKIGYHRSFYNTVHRYCNYDLEIDTENKSIQEIAEKIAFFLKKKPKPNISKNL